MTHDSRPLWSADRALAAVAIAVAALQLALALRWPLARDHLGALAVGWPAAIALGWREARRGFGRVPLAERVIAAAGLVFLVAFAVAHRAAYHPADRLVSPAFGLALVTLGWGVRGWARHARALALTATTLVCPLPLAVRGPFAGLGVTAAGAELLLRMVGFPVTRDGLLLRVPGAVVEVQGACAPVGLIGQLLALALLALCLFRARRWQAAAVVATGVVVGYAVNAGRVAFLALLASGAPSRYDLFDGDGAGAAVFPAIAAGVAGLVWWLLLRRAPLRGGGVNATASARPDAHRS